MDARAEQIDLSGQLTVEHILPENWLDHWPLPNGEKGLDILDSLFEDSDAPGVKETNERNAKLQTFGNLTILTQKLNSSISNGPWTTKKAKILEVSLLPINKRLSEYETWDESAIDHRGKELLNKALQIWPIGDGIPT